MNTEVLNLIDKLSFERTLLKSDYLKILNCFNDKNIFSYISKIALETKRHIYGDDIYIRGLIEISNICKNNCLYCGIRRGNQNCERYRMTKEQILSYCRQGYNLGIKTFVLQGGEDKFFTDFIISDIIKSINKLYPDCAVTLSLGEKSIESYDKLFKAGAQRYLLRHETADKQHYTKLHPKNMSYTNRIACLYNLKAIGYQTGCGFMVGSPFQTLENIADDIKFIESFQPEMVGIGPFIPQENTPFFDKPAGSIDLTLFLLALIRLVVPFTLLPATTALKTLDKNGFKKGITVGANVIMVNLASADFKEKYKIYDNKSCVNCDLNNTFNSIINDINQIGMKVSFSRGDCKKK